MICCRTRCALTLGGLALLWLAAAPSQAHHGPDAPDIEEAIEELVGLLPMVANDPTAVAAVENAIQDLLDMWIPPGHRHHHHHGKGSLVSGMKAFGFSGSGGGGGGGGGRGAGFFSTASAGTGFGD